MRNSLRAKTVVQSGGRIQFDVPELAEGVQVDVIVVPTIEQAKATSSVGIADFLRSLPPSGMTEAQWSQRDAEFEKNRDEWDR